MLSPMSGRKKGGSDGRAPGGGGYAKSGKPRPGTGGNRRGRLEAKGARPRRRPGGTRRAGLEGRGPTPPAYMRPGHPAQRAAAARAAADGRPPRIPQGGRGGVGRDRSENWNEGQA